MQIGKNPREWFFHHGGSEDTEDKKRMKDKG